MKHGRVFFKEDTAMDVCIIIPKTDIASFVVSVSGCTTTVSSVELADGEWHNLVPVTSHPGHYVNGYLAIHAIGQASGTTAAVKLESTVALFTLATKCDEPCKNGMVRLTRDEMMRVGKDTVVVKLRMTPAWKRHLTQAGQTDVRSEAVLDATDKDPSRVFYQFGTERGSYARLAADSYALKLDSCSWKTTLLRFVRQTELAALLLGYNLSDPGLLANDPESIYRVSKVTAELAAELFLAPLRAHGRYTLDSRFSKRVGVDDPDILSMPLFNQPRNYRVGFDCEDSALFVTYSAEQLADLFRFLDIYMAAKKLALDSLIIELGGVDQTDQIGARAIATVLSLAAKLVPLHVLVSMPKDGKKENSVLHAISMLVGRTPLRTLFGDAWQLAVSAGRIERVFTDTAAADEMLLAKARFDSGLSFTQDEQIGAVIADGVPIAVMDPCVFMSPCVSPHGAPTKWHHSWKAAVEGHAKEQQRFRVGLDASSGDVLDYTVIGVYGAGAALDLEKRKIALSALIFPFLGPTSVYSKDTFGEPFIYPRVGPPSLLPGPSFPAALEQIPVPRASETNGRPVVLSTHHSSEGTPVKLFANLPHSSLLVL